MQLLLNRINQQDKNWLIDEKKEDGFGALHLACLNNYYDIVKLFLDNGHLNVNLKNSNQQTPLHLAVERLNYEIVKLLLSFKPTAHGHSISTATLDSSKTCNVNAVDKDNDTPLHCLLRNLTILQLKKLKELNEKNNNVILRLSTVRILLL
jgi:ankyrin repeat protein